MSETTAWEIQALAADQFGQNVRVEFSGPGLPDACRRAADLLEPHQRAKATKCLADQPAFKRLKAIRGEIAALRAELQTLAGEEPTATTAEERKVLAGRRILAERRLATLRSDLAGTRLQTVQAAVLAMSREYGLPPQLKQRQSELQDQVAAKLAPVLGELVVLAAAERLVGMQAEWKTAVEAVLGDDEPPVAPPPSLGTSTSLSPDGVPVTWLRRQS